MLPRSIIAPFLVLASSAALAQSPKIKTYRVQEGETCESIALKLYGDRRLAKVIHLYNSLGPNPHMLKVGQKLIVIEASPVATITKTYGEVLMKSPQESTWKTATPGAALYLGWQISTSTLSSASLNFPDGSVSSLEEETSLTLYGKDELATTLRKDNAQAELFSGALHTSLLTEMKIVTPTSKAKLSAGEHTISIAKGGETKVVNLTGETDIIASRDSDERLSLTTGTGTTIAAGHAPEAPDKLPETPLWATNNVNTTLVAVGSTGEIQGSWSESQDAASYLVEIARDKDGEELIQRLSVPKEATSFRAKDLPLGVYYVKVSAINKAGFASAPSNSTAFRVEAPQLFAQDGSPARVEGMTLGGYFQAPLGYQCAKGEFEKPKSRLSFEQTGTFTLRCSDELGVSLPPIDVSVSAATIRVTGEPQEVALTREKPTTISFEVSGAFDESLRLQQDVYADFAPISKKENGVWQTTVTVKSTAPTSLTLHFLSGSDRDPLQVGSVSIPVETPTLVLAPTAESPSPEEPKTEERPKPKINIGLLGSNSNSKMKTLRLTRPSPLSAGLRIGVSAEFMSVETEFKFSVPAEGADSDFSGSIQAMLTTSSQGLYGFFLIGAGGEVAEDSGLMEFLCSGGGLAFVSKKGFGARVEARGVYIPEGAPTNTFHESSLGIFLRR